MLSHCRVPVHTQCPVPSSAHVWPPEQLCDRCHFSLASNERRWLDRQVVGMSLERLERWEVGRQTFQAQLKEVVWSLQVLEAMLSQVL